MNVAIYHNAYPTGAKRTIYELAREFKARGNSVDVYTTSLSDESYLLSSEVSSHFFNYPLSFLPALSPKLRLPFLRKYVGLGLDSANLANLRDVEKEIANDIADKGYDFALVHSTRLVKAPFVLRYLKSTNVPSIYFCQEPPRELYEARLSRPYLINTSLVNKIQEIWYRPAEWIWARRIRLIDQDNLRSSTCVLSNSFFLRRIFTGYTGSTLRSPIWESIQICFARIKCPRKILWSPLVPSRRSKVTILSSAL